MNLSLFNITFNSVPNSCSVCVCGRLYPSTQRRPYIAIYNLWETAQLVSGLALYTITYVMYLVSRLSKADAFMRSCSSAFGGWDLTPGQLCTSIPWSSVKVSAMPISAQYYMPIVPNLRQKWKARSLLNHVPVRGILLHLVPCPKILDPKITTEKPIAWSQLELRAPPRHRITSLNTETYFVRSRFDWVFLRLRYIKLLFSLPSILAMNPVFIVHYSKITFTVLRMKSKWKF